MLAPATHTYEIRALDGAGNASDPSNAETASVYPPDTDKPMAPANVRATVTSSGDVVVSWDAAADDVGVTGYRLFRNGQPLATVGAVTSHTDTSVAPGDYDYTVQAEDAAGNVSDPSNPAGVRVPDIEPPTAPANLNATAAGASQVDLTWLAASDNVQVTGYTVYRGTEEIATLGATTSFSDTGRPPGTHTYTVRATDAAGNRSDPSNEASLALPDTSSPTAPTDLVAAAVGPTRVELSWQASSDDVGVTEYRIYRGGGLHATVGPVTSYADTTVTASNTYSYEVRAVDGAGHVSDASDTTTATTPAPSQVLTLSPEADARVQASAATTNYATSFLRTDGGADPAVESLLRFTVSGVPGGAVQSAKLRLYATSGTVDGPAVFTTNPNWSETAVNWNTRPARTSGLTEDKGAIATNSWVEYDVTPFVAGSGTYSFGLATSSTDGADFNAREAASLRPELVVSTGPPDTQKPTAPTGLAWTAPGPTRVDLAGRPRATTWE